MFSIGLLTLIINISYIKHSSFHEHFLRIIKVFAKFYPLLTLFLYDIFSNYGMFVFSMMMMMMMMMMTMTMTMMMMMMMRMMMMIFKEGAQLALAVFSGTLKN